MALEAFLTRSRIAVLAAFSAGLAGSATGAWACQDSVTLSVQTGDGSVILNQLAGVSVAVRREGTTTWYVYSGFAPPSQTLTCFHPGAGKWDLRINLSYYFTPPPALAAVNCSGQNICTGAATFTVFRTQGSISGTARVIPPGNPLAYTTVAANKPTCASPALIRADVTNASGYYTLEDYNLGDPDYNGAAVDGDGAGPGSATYSVTVGGCDMAVGPVMVQSNQMRQADPTIRASYAEEPVRGEPQGPRPCPGLGKPVNVLNGNMFFDHTDVVVPGRAGLRFVRSYNSKTRGVGQYGAFGGGWNHSYERRLSFPATGVVALREGDGRAIYFQDSDGDLIYVASLPVTEPSKLVKTGSTYVRQLRGGGSESYDSSGRLTALTDPAANVTSLTRDGNGKLTTITDAGGRALSLTYSGNLISSLSGPSGTIATYTYTTGSLTGVTYGDGSGYVITYNSSGQLLTVADRSGRTLETHAYQSDGKAVTSEISAGQEKYTLTYTALSTAVVDALSHSTTYGWTNIWGRKVITRITGPCATCDGGGHESQEWGYDAQGRALSQKDALGRLTTYSYDASGNLATETDPLNQTTTYTYDSLGRVLTASRPDGGLTTYVWGAAGPVTVTEKVTASESRVTSITYNSFGQPVTIADPRGKVTTLTYGTAGDLLTAVDPLNHTTTFGYDSMGRRTTVTDALNHTTTTTYNPRGLVTRVTYPDATHTDFAYDLGGRRTSVTDPLGRVTTYTYDTYGRLASVADALSGSTANGYDAMSHLTSLTDARGKVTSFQYDAYGRVTRVTYPGGPFETYAYDATGKLTTRTDRRGIVTTYTYDPADRLTAKSYSDGTPAMSYTYDAAGRMLMADNGDETLNFTHDLAGQLLSEDSSANASTVAYTYDMAGNRLTVNLDGAVHASYAYDNAGRLASITRAGQVFGFAYDNANRRTQLTYPNGIATTYIYDTLSRLTRLKADRGATPITDFQYLHDATGNRTRKQQLDYTEDYSYDALYRLTRAVRGGVTTESHTYDAVGNRLSSLGSGPWTYSDRNELLSQNGTTYSYDSNGNLTQKTEGSDNWTYDWNAENQLTKVEKNGAEVARFAYDPLGRRVERVAGGVTISYTYDDAAIVRENRGTTTLKYVHGQRMDQPLAVDDGTTLTYFHADGLGSIVKETNTAGAVVLTRQYDAWGGLQAGADQAGYAFTGREWDPETALYYYRARYYVPTLGRFMNEDPIGFRGGANFYSYVDNAPTGNVDPWGLQATSPSPKPPGQPVEPPKPSFWDWIFGPPRPPNPCIDGYGPATKDDHGPNPHTQYSAWVTWKNAFIEKCEAAGSDYYATCPREGMNQPGGEGQTSVCYCCKKKCKS